MKLQDGEKVIHWSQSVTATPTQRSNVHYTIMQFQISNQTLVGVPSPGNRDTWHVLFSRPHDRGAFSRHNMPPTVTSSGGRHNRWTKVCRRVDFPKPRQEVRAVSRRLVDGSVVGNQTLTGFADVVGRAISMSRAESRSRDCFRTWGWAPPWTESSWISLGLTFPSMDWRIFALRCAVSRSSSWLGLFATRKLPQSPGGSWIESSSLCVVSGNSWRIMERSLRTNCVTNSAGRWA